jgi:hypothetical protein
MPWSVGCITNMFESSFSAHTVGLTELASGRRFVVTSGGLQIQDLCSFVLEQVLDLSALSFIRNDAEQS